VHVKLKLLALLISLTLSSQITPASGNETKTFLCGRGVTYSVLMPTGVAFNGSDCSGPLIIDSSVKIVDAAAFKSSQLTLVVIPNSVTSIGDYAFQGTPLTSVTIPNSVTSIGDGAFRGTQLTSVSIPDSVTSIGAYAFRGTQLTSVSIPDSVTRIFDRAFYAIPTLTTASLPDNLQLLSRAFDQTSKLIRIEYCGKLGGLPVKPDCPPERQAIIDAAKVAELKAKEEAEAKAKAEASNELQKNLKSQLQTWSSVLAPLANDVSKWFKIGKYSDAEAKDFNLFCDH